MTRRPAHPRWRTGAARWIAVAGLLLGTGFAAAEPGAEAGNPLAPAGAQHQGQPRGTQAIPLVPGKPLTLKWVRATPDKTGALPLPGVDVDIGRVVATSTERIAALSPEGDAVAIRDKAGRVRVVQLLSGRVSPYIPAPKDAQLSLAVSGFATAAWSAKAGHLSRWHTWTAQPRGRVAVPPTSAVVAVGPGARHAVAVQPKQAAGTETRWQLCARLLTLRGDRDPVETCWGGATSGDDVSVFDVQAVFTDAGDGVWVLATSSWSVGCGGGGEAVHVARLDATTGALVARWDSDGEPPGGTGGDADLMLDQAVAIAGADGVLAWQRDGSKATPGARSGDLWRFELAGAPRTVRAVTLAAPGSTRVVQGEGSWVRAHQHWLVTHSHGGGFVTDAVRLPQALRGGAMALADDGRHAAVTTPGGTLLWHVQRAAPVAWLPMARAPRLARSRALWRAANGELRSATWAQLEGTTPGVAALGLPAMGWWARALSAAAATGAQL